MRITGIDSVLSLNIFNELSANNVLDSARYLRFGSDSLRGLVRRDSTSFPVLRSLTLLLLDHVTDQIDVTFAGHQVYGENNKGLLSFLNELCTGTVGVEYPSSSIVPKEFALHQNYPNPFNPTTTIQYDLPSAGLVSLKVFDILGREVRTLVSDNLQPGSYEVTFDATGLVSGVYFYRMQGGEFVQTKRLLLLR